MPIHQLVRFNEALSGSPIWMKAMTGRNIVQDHSFWEIRDGKTVKFWDDSWNQLLILGRDPRWIHIKEKALEEGKVQVSQFWMIRNLEDQRQWDFQEKLELTSAEDWGDFQEQLLKSFVKV